MKKRIPAVLFGVLLLQMSGLAFAADPDNRQLLDEARKVSARLASTIRGELVRELERTGPVRAVIVCKYSAPEASAAISRETGMRVTRVSLRPRNRAIGDPDVWEQRTLLDFEKRVAAGESPEGLEYSEVVVEPVGRYFRYMKAIPMEQTCRACHGTVDDISQAVKVKLSQEYPRDNAVNYRMGQVRGAVSIKNPL